MKITIDLESVLNEDQLAQIGRLLGGLTKDSAILAFCCAAIAESADAILSRQQESATSTPQRRLYHLIMKAFDGVVPSEVAVSRIFGITDRKAAAMIATVAKRYRDEFEKGWVTAIKAAFDTKEPAKDSTGNFYKFNASKTLIDYLRDVVADLAKGRLAPIQKLKDAADVYEIREDTYNAVCASVGVEAKKQR